MKNKCCCKNKNQCCCPGPATFICPPGPRGPQGPQGSQGERGPVGIANLDSILVSFDRIQTVASNSLVNLGITINATGTSISFIPSNTIELTEGSYVIFYSVLIANTGASGDVGASMLVNGIVANNAAVYIPASTSQKQFSLIHSLTVTAPTTSSIKNASSVSNNYHDSSILVLKIG